MGSDFNLLSRQIAGNDTNGRTVRGGETNGDNDYSRDQQVGNTNVDNRRKHYQRHSQYQIQNLEAFFKTCTYPDYNQMKMNLERSENIKRITENEKLHAENLRLRGLLSDTSYLNYGGPRDFSLDEHHLPMEIGRLKGEVTWIKHVEVEKIRSNTILLPSPLSRNGKRSYLGAFISTAENGSSKMVCDKHIVSEACPFHIPSQIRRFNGNHVYKFPPYMKESVISVHDVLGDGNCGYRALGVGLGRGERSWPEIRRELLQNLDAHLPEYYSLYENILTTRDALGYFDPWTPAPRKYWMVFPEMGFLIASTYNIALVILHPEGGNTYLPLRSKPEQSFILVCLYAIHEHYVAVKLKPGCLLPQILPANKKDFPCWADWEQCIQSRTLQGEVAGSPIRLDEDD